MATSQDKNRQIWLTGILLALAVVTVLGERSLRPPPRVGAPAGAAPVVALEPLVPYLAVDSTGVAHEVGATSSVGVARDPFQSSESPPRVAQRSPATDTRRADVPPQQPINVSAILISDNRRAAVINDVIVNLGAELPGGWRLTAVERDHVVVTDPKGIRRTININSGAL